MRDIHVIALNQPPSCLCTVCKRNDQIHAALAGAEQGGWTK